MISIIKEIGEFQDDLYCKAFTAHNNGEHIKGAALGGAAGFIDGIELYSMIPGAVLSGLGVYILIKAKFGK
jgi:hypothetical protein